MFMSFRVLYLKKTLFKKVHVIESVERDPHFHNRVFPGHSAWQSISQMAFRPIFETKS